MAQIKWMLDYLDDIESDMSVFHRVDDIWSMPGPRFFRLAWRLSAYRGVMRERLLAEQRRDEGPGNATRAAAPQTPAQTSRQPGYRRVPAVKSAIRADPELSGIFSFGTIRR